MMVSNQMTLPLHKEFLDALACPCCESGTLLLTKEKIIICQKCLKGFRVRNDVPDFRVEHAISFKRKTDAQNKNVSKALITVLIGDNRNQMTGLKNGHCLVLGRLVGPDFNVDKTFVGRPDFRLVEQFTRMGSDHQKLVDQYLKRSQPVSEPDPFASGCQQFLGDFLRDADFVFPDAAVSRTHAVVFYDADGLKLLDLVSKNGTYVNGKEVEFFCLKNNDVVSIGNSSMRINFL